MEVGRFSDRIVCSERKRALKSEKPQQDTDKSLQYLESLLHKKAYNNTCQAIKIPCNSVQVWLNDNNDNRSTAICDRK